MHIDIAIPFRGDIDYLFESIQSVIWQTHADWTLRILDNASDELDVAERIEALGDARIIYFRHERNIGICRNFEFARAQIESPWGVILGADDLLHPTYLESMIMLAEKYSNAAFIHPAVNVIDQDGRSVLPLVDLVKRLIMPRLRTPKEMTIQKIIPSLMLGNWLYAPSIFWNMKYLRDRHFRNDLTLTFDLEMEIRILIAAKSMVQSPESLVSYRRHAVSLSSAGKKGMKRFLEEAAIYEELADLLKASNYRRASIFAKLRLTHRAHVLLSLIGIRHTFEVGEAFLLIFADGGMSNPDKRAEFLLENS